MPERGGLAADRNILLRARSRTGRGEERIAEFGEGPYHRVVAGFPRPVFLFDMVSLAIADVNEAAVRRYGFPRRELLGRTILDLFEEEEAHRFEGLLARTGAAGDDEWVGCGTWRQHAADGSRIDVDLTLVAIRFRGRAVWGLVVDDVTERRRTEDALRDSEGRLRAVVESLPVVVWAIDEDGVFRFLQGRGREPLGVPADRLLGKSIFRIWKKLPETLQAARRALDGDPGPILYRGGLGLVFEQRSSPIREADGRIVGAIGVTMDVTERQRAQEARERHTERQRRLADASLSIHASLGVNDAVQRLTDAAREIIGAHQAVTSFTIDENWAQAVTAVSLSDKYAAWRGYDAKPDGSGIYHLVCRHNRPMRLTQTELEAHPAWRGFGVERSSHPPIRGWLAVPITGFDGRNLGLVQLSDKVGDDFDEDDEAVLVQLAQLAGVTMENALLFEQVESARGELEQVSRRLFEVQETERRHVARELHDEIGQTLTGLRMALDADGFGPVPLERARLLVDQLIHRVRDLSLDLRPAMLDDLGLLPALYWLIERYARETSLQVQLRHDGIEGRRFPSPAETAVYRIVQEALTNVVRHAGVLWLSVHVVADAEALHVEVRDTGRGFDPARRSGGAGVLGMRERAMLLGGRLEIVSAVGAGTRVRAEIPLGEGV